MSTFKSTLPTWGEISNSRGKFHPEGPETLLCQIILWFPMVLVHSKKHMHISHKGGGHSFE